MMRFALICLLLATAWPADATQRKNNLPAASDKPSVSAPARSAPVTRPNLPTTIATATGAGQSGYVHFFVLEMPDGNEEMQVGLELPDGRIAWSFPELGVVVSPFIRSGEVDANGRLYTVRHRYGIRPFPDDGAMRSLQKDLIARVAFWVEDGTPYCNPPPPRAERLCMSCLSFVLQVLFPGRTPAYPALPRNFGLSGPDGYYSTDDLLIYVTGMGDLPTKAARMKRIEGLAMPQNLRQELVQLVEEMDANRVADSAKGTPRNLNEKMRSGARSYSRTPPQKKRL